MKYLRLLSLTLLLCFGSCTKPHESATHFAGGQAPVVVKQSLRAQTTVLGFEAYTVMHSGVARIPLWSAEHLTRASVAAARQLKRVNRFHAETRLPADARAELSDYARSGFDRGHMSPSGDMPSELAQQESFSLANIIPQNPNNNQHLWEAMEEATRTLAEQEGDIFVVTGPLFEGEDLQRLNGRVLVPSSIYKALYDPRRKAAAAYVTRNAPGMRYDTVSIADLEERCGVNLFPALSKATKAVAMELPVPASHHARRRTVSSQP
ncbi:MAG: hypothetical protein NVSMB6_18020 [Burkholderiaceae bacterium]